MTQRDAMRSLWRRYAGNHEAVIREYARMEQRGEVQRGSNEHRLRPEEYAQALLNDGLRKGWLE
jgi:hypothetical protein